MSICGEKKYTHVVWTDDIKKYWIRRTIELNTIADESIEYEYFVSYDELKNILGLDFNFENKESIKKHIELFGKDKTWEIIKSKCDENFLNLLF